MSQRKTKIIATLGPASATVDQVEALYEAGVDVARINLSHGSSKTHQDAVSAVKTVQREKEVRGRPLALMLDTRGPEIRITNLEEPLILRPGDSVWLMGLDGEEETQENLLRVNIPDLSELLKSDDVALIDDGRIRLEIEATDGISFRARAINGGTIRPKKSVSFPGVPLSLPFLSDHDLKDIYFAARVGADWLALSFVQNAQNILQVRDHLETDDISIVAKIETLLGYQNLDDILEVTDAIMIGRGDLGIDCPPEDIPLIQKDIISRCNAAGIPVITATQMLESMIENPTATRAEASDVANAILDGTDAVMLSAETAAGKYPLPAVETMNRIIRRTEAGGWGINTQRADAATFSGISVTDAVAHSAVWIAQNLGAEAILTPTQSGHTARMVAKYRPSVPIVAITHSPKVRRRLSLVWGVHPLVKEDGDEVSEAGHIALTAGYLSAGALVVITSGFPQGVPGTTNAVQVRTLGKVLLEGSGIGRSHAHGRACIQSELDERFNPNVTPGDILVMRSWQPFMGPVVENAAALVAEEPGLSSSAALVGLSYGIPVIVGVEGATTNIPPGEMITVDAPRGLVYAGKTSI